MWVGPISDQKVVASARRFAGAQGLAKAAEVMASLAGVDDFPPWSFSIETVCSSLGVATVPEDQVYRQLLSNGHRATRTPFERTGVKTDADFREVVAAVRSAAKGRA
jgi:tRNA G26 N,N-dimethylase Trm1